MATAWLSSYIYYSTLTYVFSLRLMGASGMGIRLIELNLLLLCLVIKVTRIPRWIFWFLLYITASWVIGLAHGTSLFSWSFLEYRAIVINVLYYYYFFKLIRNDADRAFLAYARLAFWFAAIAIPLWAFSIGKNLDPRLHGLATEPAQFCVLIMPAFYWYAHLLLTTRKHIIEVAVFALAVALSASSLGYMCVAFGIVLLLSRRKRYLLVAPLVVGALLSAAYVASPSVRLRVDSALLIAATGDVTGAQLSTYSFVSNAIVTQQVLEESPLIGNGIGSHPVSHARFLDSIPGVEYFSGMNLQSMNAYEAGSLTFRVLSECGVLGYLGVLFFVFHFHVGGSGKRAAISNAILICFFLKLLRSGEYYQPEQFFFIFIYMLNYQKFKSEAPSQEPLLVRRKPWFKFGSPSQSLRPSRTTAADIL